MDFPKREDIISSNYQTELLNKLRHSINNIDIDNLKDDPSIEYRR